MLQIHEYKFDDINLSLKSEFQRIDNTIKKILIEFRRNNPLFINFFEEVQKRIPLEGGKEENSFIMMKREIVESMGLIKPSDFDQPVKIKDLNFIERDKLTDELATLKVNIDKESMKRVEEINSRLDENFKLNIWLSEVIDYDKYRHELLKFYYQKNFTNCHYCLAQYTSIYRSDKKNYLYLKGNLDHYFPQKDNALLGISLNNLVPVCAHCNQRKSKQEFTFKIFKKKADIIVNPTFVFENCLTIQNAKLELRNLDQLIINNIDSDLLEKLELDKLYQGLSSSVINLLERYQKFNSKSYKNHIESITGVGIGSNLEYFISEIPYDEENIRKVPLQKFKSDFYNELESYKATGKLKFDN